MDYPYGVWEETTKDITIENITVKEQIPLKD